MSPALILTIVAGYFLLLFVISWITGRNADSDTFFKANRQSPWYLVAFGMIGASLSGVTFISIPGAVSGDQFSYMQMVFGYLIGYAVIAFVLMPIYYRLNLTSIYTFLEERFGFWAYKTGAAFFLLSRVVGASFRLYLVAIVMQNFVLGPYGVPFWVTVAGSIFLIWIYTFRGGIKTVVWTDTLQTFFMLVAVGIAVYVIASELGLGLTEIPGAVADSPYSRIFFFDDPSYKHWFVKDVLAGALIAIVMTGLDQDMMQKNLTCRNLRDAQKNMISFSLVLVIVNLVFLSLGALLYAYGTQTGAIGPVNLAEGGLCFTDAAAGACAGNIMGSDNLFPALALQHLPAGIGVLFILGLTAAAYSSADSALTALTTSFCVDFLDFEKNPQATGRDRRRMAVHLAFSLLLFLVILAFYQINDNTVISAIFTFAGYTYGPLLGLFSFGVLSKRKLPDHLGVAVVCILAPVVGYFLNLQSGNWFGFFIVGLNGALVFTGLLGLSLLSGKTSDNNNSPDNQ